MYHCSTKSSGTHSAHVNIQIQINYSKFLSLKLPIFKSMVSCKKPAYEQSGPSVPELIPVSVTWSNYSRNISTPPGWGASPLQGFPRHWICWYPVVSGVERGTMKVKNKSRRPYPRTQCNVPARDWTWTNVYYSPQYSKHVAFKVLTLCKIYWQLFDDYMYVFNSCLCMTSSAIEQDEPSPVLWTAPSARLAQYIQK